MGSESVPGTDGVCERGSNIRLGVRAVRSVSLILCAYFASGCSFIFTSGPPPKPDDGSARPPGADCSTSRAPPIVDSILAGLQVARTAYAATADKSVYENFPISREADIGIGVALTAVAFVSGAYGFGATSSCQEYHEEQAEVEAAERKRAQEREAYNYSQSRMPTAGYPPQQPQAPVDLGPSCEYDTQCAETHVCEQEHCVPYRGQP